MHRFNLAELASGKTRRREVVLPAIADQLGVQRAIERELRQMLRTMADQVKADVLPAALADIARYQRTFTGDVGEFAEKSLLALKATAARLGGIAAGLVGRILRLSGKRHSDRWKDAVRSALGIDLELAVREEDIVEPLDAAAKRAAALIAGLSNETAAGVETLVRRAVTQGMTAGDLRKELTKQFGIGERRAKIIARDQLATLNSDLNRIRHTQAGIATYDWSTAHDERVRPLHRAIDGRRYKYGERTGAEGGLPPGQPIMCRCVALAVVTFDGKEF